MKFYAIVVTAILLFSTCKGSRALEPHKNEDISDVVHPPSFNIKGGNHDVARRNLNGGNKKRRKRKKNKNNGGGGKKNKNKNSGGGGKEKSKTDNGGKGHCERISDIERPLPRHLAEQWTHRDFCPCTLKHVVSFKFKDDVPQEVIDEVAQQVRGFRHELLRDGEPYIRAVTAGPPNSYEGWDYGHELAFVMTFYSQGDRNYYVGTDLIDPEHTDLYDPIHHKFKQKMGGLLDLEYSPFLFVYDYCA